MSLKNLRLSVHWGPEGYLGPDELEQLLIKVDDPGSPRHGQVVAVLPLPPDKELQREVIRPLAAMMAVAPELFASLDDIVTYCWPGDDAVLNEFLKTGAKALDQAARWQDE